MAREGQFSGLENIFEVWDEHGRGVSNEDLARLVRPTRSNRLPRSGKRVRSARELRMRDERLKRVGDESEERAARLFERFYQVLGVEPANKIDDLRNMVDFWVVCFVIIEQGEQLEAKVLKVPVDAKSSRTGVFQTQLEQKERGKDRFLISCGNTRSDEAILREIERRFPIERGVRLTRI